MNLTLTKDASSDKLICSAKKSGLLLSSSVQTASGGVVDNFRLLVDAAVGKQASGRNGAVPMRVKQGETPKAHSAASVSSASSPFRRQCSIKTCTCAQFLLAESTAASVIATYQSSDCARSRKRLQTHSAWKETPFCTAITAAAKQVWVYCPRPVLGNKTRCRDKTHS